MTYVCYLDTFISKTNFTKDSERFPKGFHFEPNLGLTTEISVIVFCVSGSL